MARYGMMLPQIDDNYQVGGKKKKKNESILPPTPARRDPSAVVESAAGQNALNTIQDKREKVNTATAKAQDAGQDYATQQNAIRAQASQNTLDLQRRLTNEQIAATQAQQNRQAMIAGIGTTHRLMPSATSAYGHNGVSSVQGNPYIVPIMQPQQPAQPTPEQIAYAQQFNADPANKSQYNGAADYWATNTAAQAARQRSMAEAQARQQTPQAMLQQQYMQSLIPGQQPISFRQWGQNQAAQQQAVQRQASDREFAIQLAQAQNPPKSAGGSASSPAKDKLYEAQAEEIKKRLPQAVKVQIEALQKGIENSLDDAEIADMQSRIETLVQPYLPAPVQPQQAAPQTMLPPTAAPAPAAPMVAPVPQQEVTATNPQTGQRVVLRNGQWVPIQ